MNNNFCDFCDCDDCKYGAEWLCHSECIDGRWICDVCWRYDVCTSGEKRSKFGPCENENGKPIANCEHRPTLKTGIWIKK